MLGRASRAKSRAPRGQRHAPVLLLFAALAALAASALLLDARPATAAPTVPDAPTNIVATAGDAQATVTWDAAASDGGSAITSYTVTSSPEGLQATTPDGATLDATVTGLTNGVEYTFTVVATNAVGDGPASTPSNAVTPAPPTVPDAPTNVGATAGDTQATVTWDAPASDGGSAITSYTVTSSPGALQATTPDGATLNATVTGLTNGTEYTFAVVATNDVGDDPASVPSNAVTPAPPPTVPDAPTNVVATAGDAEASVTWDASASDGGSAITSYTVTSSPEGLQGTTPDGATLNATVTGLTNGTEYTFTVVATSDVGDSAASAPSNAVTPAPPPTVPDAPTNVVATAGDAEASVTWDAPASDGGSAITSYTVTSSPGALQATTPDGATLNATVTGLTNGVEYTFAVVATNDVGDGPASAASNAVTPAPPAPPTVPDAPTNVVAMAGDAEASVTWDAPASDGGSAITSYTVTSSPGALQATTPDGATLNATVTGLTNGVEYTFTVVATNDVGDGAASTSSNAVTPAAPTVPDAPTNVVATAGDTQAAVTWDAPASDGGSAITSYTVTSSPEGLQATTPDGATLNATVTGLTNGIEYTFTVVATNAVGDGPASAPSNAVTPVPAVAERFLHAADALVGGSTYNTVNALPAAGVLATASASIEERRVDVQLADPAGVSIFVSDAVPQGKVWDLQGSWDFDVWMSANTDAKLRLSARLYRISPGGAATEIVAMSRTDKTDVSGSYVRFTWSHSVPPGVTLSGGERFGVRFHVYSEDDEDQGSFAIMGFDEASAPSSLTAAIAESDAPGRVRAAHFRIGYDAPLIAMTWFAATDVPATNFVRDRTFRVRFQLYNDGASSANWAPRIEWSTAPGSGYAAVPTAPGGDPFYVVDTPAFDNGEAIGAGDFALGAGSGVAQAGVAYDTENPPALPIALASLSHTELEFSLYVTGGAADGQTYYFRLTDAGAPLATYDVAAPSITLGFPWPPPPPQLPPAHNSHQPYSADTASCASCHRAHTSPAPAALAIEWPEEQVCFTCHDGSAAADVFTPFMRAFRMPITESAGTHAASESLLRDPTSFAGANRHVECQDCHEPHDAAQGSHPVGSNYAYGSLQGMWGIAVTNTAAWSAPVFTPADPIAFQYQLCFKCHSSWAYGGSPPLSPSGQYPQTDQAKEFNTLNASFHPVEDVGRNRYTYADGSSYAGSLIGGFTPSSRMVCSDCHASSSGADRAGPHGSASAFILRGEWDRTTGWSGTEDHLCFSCHDFSVYGEDASSDATAFSKDVGGGNLHDKHVGNKENPSGEKIGCMDCHTAIPHGYFRDRLIGYTGDGPPYVDRPYAGGLTDIPLPWPQPGNWDKNDCTASCH